MRQSREFARFTLLTLGSRDLRLEFARFTMLGQKNMLTIVESKEHGENVCQTLFVAVPFFVLDGAHFRSIGRSIKHSSKTKVLFFSNYKKKSTVAC